MHYEEISEYYERVFPLNPAVVAFLGERIGPTDRVLDLGCGTGSLAAALSSGCHEIIGYDLDREMIRCGRERRPALDLRQADIRQLPDDLGCFDVIYSVGNVLSYLSKEELGELCRSVHGRLNAGGRWIYQVVNWDYYAQQATYDFPKKQIDELTFHRSYTHGDGDEMQFKIRLEGADVMLVDELHTLHAIDRKTHRRLNTSAGLVEESCALNWDGEAWSAEKPGAIIAVYISH